MRQRHQHPILTAPEPEPAGPGPLDAEHYGNAFLLEQLRAAGGEPVDPIDTALEGARGGDEIPWLAEIQASFGLYDVTRVRATAGARQASEALGAEAYAVGDAVAFGDAPSLREAAHEAAHVVQQRAGLRPQGGLGRGGDPLERHADRVADAVVRGEPAEGLLDGLTGGRGRSGAAAAEAVQPWADPQAADRVLREIARADEATLAQVVAALSAARANGAAGVDLPTGSFVVHRQDVPDLEARAADRLRQLRSAQGGPPDRVPELRRALERLRSQLAGALEGHRALQRLRSEQWFVGATAEVLSGAGDLPPLSMWDAVGSALAEAEHALADHVSSRRREDLERVGPAVARVSRAYQDCDARLSLYRSRTEDGAEQGAESLRIVVATCVLAATIAGGGAALPALGVTGVTATSAAGLTATATGAGLGAGAGTLGLGLAGQWSERQHGERGGYDLQALLADAGTAAVNAFVGTLLGGALSRWFTTALVRGMLGRMSGEQLATVARGLNTTVAEVEATLLRPGERVVVDFLSGVATTPVTTATTAVISRVRGRPITPQAFEEMVVHETVQGGIVGLFLSTITHGRAAPTAARAPGERTAIVPPEPTAPAAAPRRPAPADTPASPAAPAERTTLVPDDGARAQGERPASPPGEIGAPELRSTILPGQVTELTDAQAAAVLADLAGDAAVPFRYPIDGCYWRAHEMSRRLTELGVASDKVFAVANDPTGAGLRVESPHAGDTPPGRTPTVEWGWHVAPIVHVRRPTGQLVEVVLDPSMSSLPMTLDRWTGAMSGRPFQRMTVEQIAAYRAQAGDPSGFPVGADGALTVRTRRTGYAADQTLETDAATADQAHDWVGANRIPAYRQREEAHALAGQIRELLRTPTVPEGTLCRVIEQAAPAARAGLRARFPLLLDQVRAAVSPAAMRRIEAAL